MQSKTGYAALRVIERLCSSLFCVARSALAVLACLAITTTAALACADHEYRDDVGICWPKAGGDVAAAAQRAKEEAEKLKQKMLAEAANAERDIRVWIDTGKCGGDVCDALAAAATFSIDNFEDIGPTLRKASERLAEGKPVDAVWHIGTDTIRSSNDNATKALQRSTLLGAVAQVAASVYGGPYGATAYSAWLTYNQTGGDIGSALKAGLISGATAYALGDVTQIDLTATSDIARAAVLTASINGLAVAAAGGTNDQIRSAAALGVATVLIRAGYRKLTKFDLDRERLKSSQGDSYCKAEIPRAEYFTGAAGSPCLPPATAYRVNAANEPLDIYGNVADENHPPFIDQSKLDPSRPHVGMWADGSKRQPLGINERSTLMRGASSIPGVNAMAVGHDAFDARYIDHNMMIDIVPRVATIPPALTLTYVGSGEYIHDMIREGLRGRQEPTAQTRPAPATAQSASPQSRAHAVEEMQIVCGTETLDARIDVATQLTVQASGASAVLRPSTTRICELVQTTRGRRYPLWHAHHQTASCFNKASEIIARYQDKGFVCFASEGLRTELRASALGARQ